MKLGDQWLGKKHKPESNKKRSETIKRLYAEGKIMGFRSEKGKEALKLTPHDYWKGKTLPYKVWNKGISGAEYQKHYPKGFGAEKNIGRFVGAKSPNWKGGTTYWGTKIRMSREYKLWRTAVFERDNYQCIWCGYRGNQLQADHIKPFAYFPELRFAIDNGRTLCKSCHKKTDSYLSGARKYKNRHEQERK